ncbi:MAG: hypothetical protein KME45_29075 [Stenomitos rutilans HA7619-LM2]|jgi:hypothetical protein|nr:hypothetical protein [Stenomitos rutilans HA7619-LM2]
MSTEQSNEPSKIDTTERSNADNQKASVVAAVVMLIVGVMVLLPTFEFLRSGGLSPGEHALAKVLLLSSMGGALGTVICTKGRRNRLMAIFPGALMGIGVPLALTAYVLLFHRHTLFKIECVLPLMIGTLPGFLLYVALMKPVKPES